MYLLMTTFDSNFYNIFMRKDIFSKWRAVKTEGCKLHSNTEDFFYLKVAKQTNIKQDINLTLCNFDIRLTE